MHYRVTDRDDQCTFTWCQGVVIAKLVIAILFGIARDGAAAAAQFTAYFPLPANASTSAAPTQRPLPPPSGTVPAGEFSQWQAYNDTWQSHHREPANQHVRQQLGITGDSTAIRVASGRSTAAAMRLPLTDMRRYESQHFVLLSDAEDPRARLTLDSLERFYAVWTQLFFPLWKHRDYWDRSLKPMPPGAAIKHRVVLFARSARYADVLRSAGPGISQSTGFYSDLKRITFLRDDDGDDHATRFHEVTHQLMSEATGAKPRLRPGEERDFWIVEGIACYMESTRFDQDHATVGAWTASRLQYARHRVLGLGDEMEFDSLTEQGRLAVQQREDLARWYSFATAYTHQCLDDTADNGLISTLQRLARIYQVNSNALPIREEPSPPTESLIEYLNLTDAQLTPVKADTLRDLCLTRTGVTAAGLRAIEPQRLLKWLDCSFLPLTTADVVRLCPEPTRMEQLSLESTQVDDSLGDWLAGATQLRELDLSQCAIGDAVLGKLPAAAPLETLWLTGSRVSDASIDIIAAIKTLQRVDLQQSAVSPEGVARLRAARNDLQINPLEVTSP